MRPLQVLNGDLEVSLNALEVADQTVISAKNMLEGLEPTIFFLVGGNNEEVATIQISSGERIVELLELGRGKFLEANDNINMAQEYLDKIDFSLVSTDLLLQLNTLIAYHDLLSEINLVLLDAPDLLTDALALNEDQTYLILAQNSDELRPSGGYVSTYGWMTIRDGQILEYDYHPTTATSPNPPPESFAEQIDIPEWWLAMQQPIYAAWDSSWSVNFPDTAERAKWFYDNGNNVHAPVDGVIAIDLVGFEYLLEAMGDVALVEQNVVVNRDNFREVVYDIRASGLGILPHKEFVADVYQQIFDEWQNIAENQAKSSDVLEAFLQGLREKHILFYFADENLNNAVQLLGWAGQQVTAAEHDYLMVVDTNLGNKSNRSIQRGITLDVEIQSDGQTQNRLSLTYEYPSRLAENDPAVDPEFHGSLDYNNLLQIFVPTDSEVIEIDNVQRGYELYPVDGYTLIVTRTGVDYDTTERLQYLYSMPSKVETIGNFQQYRLLIQKQPGTHADTVNVQITLPTDAQIIETNPPPIAQFQLESTVLEFRFDLLTDQWVEILYQ